jgi:riboflavin synthase alpha subunit
MISQNQDHTLHQGDSIEYEGAVWTVSGFEQEIVVWSSNPDKVEHKTTLGYL